MPGCLVHGCESEPVTKMMMVDGNQASLCAEHLRQLLKIAIAYPDEVLGFRVRGVDIDGRPFVVTGALMSSVDWGFSP